MKVTKKQINIFIFTFITSISPAMAAPLSLEDLIVNGLRLVGLLAFAASVVGIGWGVVEVMRSWQGLKHGADQQQDPQIMTKFGWRMAAGIGSAASIAIMLAVIMSFFGTTEVLNFITFDTFGSDKFIDFNI